VSRVRGQSATRQRSVVDLAEVIVVPPSAPARPSSASTCVAGGCFVVDDGVRGAASDRGRLRRDLSQHRAVTAMPLYVIGAVGCQSSRITLCARYKRQRAAVSQRWRHDNRSFPPACVAGSRSFRGTFGDLKRRIPSLLIPRYFSDTGLSRISRL
jgi:hypothetical protein